MVSYAPFDIDKVIYTMYIVTQRTYWAIYTRYLYSSPKSTYSWPCTHKRIMWTYEPLFAVNIVARVYSFFFFNVASFFSLFICSFCVYYCYLFDVGVMVAGYVLLLLFSLEKYSIAITNAIKHNVHTFENMCGFAAYVALGS